MKKQGLIAVDLDGTLIDTVAVNAESYRRALESFGFTLDYDYYAAYCNGRHYRAFLQPLMGGNPSAEDVERVHDLKKQYYAANMDIARKNEALFVILEALRPTHYLAVITTGSRQNATEMLDHFHCTDWFDLILTQEDVVNNKPDPEGYLKAMAHFGVDAAHTMIFEDSATGLAAAMIPIIISVLQSVKTPGIDVVGMTMILQYVVSFGFILPVNAPQNMIAYGTDTFEVHDFVRAGIPLTIIAFALIMILGATYWKWLGYMA